MVIVASLTLGAITWTEVQPMQGPSSSTSSPEFTSFGSHAKMPSVRPSCWCARLYGSVLDSLESSARGLP